MVLSRNPDNFFAETEQVAYCPGNIVPGIDFSNDPLLQGRLFPYIDTQISRFRGPNFHQIPVNAPCYPFDNMQRDGVRQTQVPNGRVNYEPNCFGCCISLSSSDFSFGKATFQAINLIFRQGRIERG
jgi:catalase